MFQSQLRREIVKSSRLLLIAKQLIRMSQINVKRWIKIFHPFVVHRVRPVERFLVPTESVFVCVLEAGDVVGSDAGFVIVCRGFPGSPVEGAGVVRAVLIFRLRACVQSWMMGLVKSILTASTNSALSTASATPPTPTPLQSKVRAAGSPRARFVTTPAGSHTIQPRLPGGG